MRDFRRLGSAHTGLERKLEVSTGTYVAGGEARFNRPTFTAQLLLLPLKPKPKLIKALFQLKGVKEKKGLSAVSCCCSTGIFRESRL